MILCLGPTPAAQRVMVFHRLELGRVNRAKATLEGIAGKAVNVAKVLSALGQEPVVAGFAGGERGKVLARALEERGIATHFVECAQKTRLCTTVVDSHRGSQTELVEESKPLSQRHYSALLKVVTGLLRSAKALVMSGTLTPGAPANFYWKCTALAHRGELLTVIDAKGAPLLAALPAKPGLVKPNRAELASMFSSAPSNKPNLFNLMRQLHERGAQRVVVTDGARPTLAYDGKTFWRITTPRLRVLNPIGSGDAFTAALTWKLLAGAGLEEACRWGSAAGLANALTIMPGELEPATVRRLVKRVELVRLSPR